MGTSADVRVVGLELYGVFCQVSVSDWPMERASSAARGTSGSWRGEGTCRAASSHRKRSWTTQSVSSAFTKSLFTQEVTSLKPSQYDFTHQRGFGR